MYEVVDDYLLDRLPVALLSADDKKALDDALEALTLNSRPIAYRGQLCDDGSWQISIPIGVRRILLGYDIDDLRRVVTLNYVKWEKYREALDWVLGLLGNEPGGTK